ncbi:hypothetical protein [Halothermothrix orenii]|uniref:Uncharacterized protein n=1 Tax=Halothermothrix orenii (strain H 168 / OCM 544 / DSM 9562) TaxID=373903 RepID=B8D155_HALOH|nr:hypothetical protein [Halothermothrix orenii]ACL69024.1 hypothetical protein Hore_02630 [Halothermothrix orenii H 168]
MLDYNNSTTVFLWVLAFYFLPMVVGFILGKIKTISLTKISEIGYKLGDPVTTKIHNWSRKYKLLSIKNGHWLLLFLLIFLNNLILVAFVRRIFYGIIFVIPLLLTAWTGFGHGVLFSKPKGRAGILLIFFEFGGYLFATVIGVKIGICILISLISNNQPVISIPWDYVLPAVVFLMIGAAIETLSIKAASKNMDLNNIDKINFEQRRAEIAKQIDDD